jgi:hypothetical protein
MCVCWGVTVSLSFAHFKFLPLNSTTHAHISTAARRTTQLGPLQYAVGSHRWKGEELAGGTKVEGKYFFLGLVCLALLLLLLSACKLCGNKPNIAFYSPPLCLLLLLLLLPPPHPLISCLKICVFGGRSFSLRE